MSTYDWKSLVIKNDKDFHKKKPVYTFGKRKFTGDISDNNYYNMGLGVRPERLYPTYDTAYIVCYADDGSGNKSYKLMWPVTGNTGSYYSFDFGYKVAFNEVEECNTIGSMSIVVPMISSSDYTRTGTWTTHTNANAYTGTYYESVLGGDAHYATFVTPVTTSTRVGLRCVIAGNGGLGKVTVDGEPSKANLLPTALQLYQEGLIDDDTFAQFRKDDRIINYCGSLNYNAVVMIAEGLTAEEHTIVVTSTGLKPLTSLSSVARTYVTGFVYGNASTAIGDTGADLDGFGATKYIVKGSDSVVEYAIMCRPTAGGDLLFIGNGHGNDTQTSLVITVDGDVTVLASGESASGASIVITRTSNLTHPDFGGGTATFCEVEQKYTLAGLGLFLERTEVWKADTTFSTSYAIMWPCEGTFSMGATAVDGDAWTSLTANDNGLYCRASSDLIYVYEPGGNYALAMSCGSGTSYSLTTTGLYECFIQDRALNAGLIHKMYAIGEAYTTVVADTTLTWSGRLLPVFYEAGL